MCINLDNYRHLWANVIKLLNGILATKAFYQLVMSEFIKSIVKPKSEFTFFCVKVVIKIKVDEVLSIKSSKDGKWISYSQGHLLAMFLLIIICRRDKFTKIDLDYEQLSTLNAP